MIFEQLHPKWQLLLADQQDTLARLEERAAAETQLVPKMDYLLRAFETDPLRQRVVIIGQDPYPNPVHATGLAFSVPSGTKPLPPTLRNIAAELSTDLEAPLGQLPDFDSWSRQGVLLLNRHLSTAAGQTAAHTNWGWAAFTTVALTRLQEVRDGRLVAILWGNRARELEPILNKSVLICSAHPSPLSSYRGFFGSRPFSRANRALEQMGETPIDWADNA